MYAPYCNFPVNTSRVFRAPLLTYYEATSGGKWKNGKPYKAGETYHIYIREYDSGLYVDEIDGADLQNTQGVMFMKINRDSHYSPLIYDDGGANANVIKR